MYLSISQKKMISYLFLHKNKRKFQWIFLLSFISLSIIEVVFTTIFLWKEDVFDDPIDANIYLIDPRIDYKVFFILFIIDTCVCLSYIVYWLVYVWSKASALSKNKKIRSKVTSAVKIMSHECSDKSMSSTMESKRCSFATYNNRLHIFYRTPIMLLVTILFTWLYSDRIDDFQQDLSLPLSVFICSQILIIILLLVACISTPLPSHKFKVNK